MTVNAASQALELFACVITGSVCAIVFELFEFLQIALKRKKFWVFLFDLMFSAAALSAVLFTLLTVSSGETLLYHLLGLGTGFYAVNHFFSDFARKYIVKAGKYVARLYARFKNTKLFEKIVK
jgi:Spore cortex protein YabQ (Spore_YabQ).